MKRKVLNFLVVSLLLVFVGLEASGASQDPESSPTAAEAGQLGQRLSALESQVESLSEKYEQSAGFRDTEYILRIQQQYQTFYEKVLSTQTYTVWGIGLFLTLLFALGGRFSFRLFDRQIEYTIKGVTGELRRSFDERLATELEALEKKNSEQVSNAVQILAEKTDQGLADLEVRDRAHRLFSQGLIFASLEQHDQSIKNFRNVLELYVTDKGRRAITKPSMVAAIANMARSMRRKDSEKFEENMRKELENHIYRNLNEELALAATDFKQLAALLPVPEKASPDNADS